MVTASAGSGRLNPSEYWLDANDEPAAYAFGMRPPACRVPLWNGDSPSLESLRIGDSPSPSCC